MKEGREPKNGRFINVALKRPYIRHAVCFRPHQRSNLPLGQPKSDDEALLTLGRERRKKEPNKDSFSPPSKFALVFPKGFLVVRLSRDFLHTGQAGKASHADRIRERKKRDG